MQTSIATHNYTMPGQPAQSAYTELHDLAKLRMQSKHNQTDAMRDVAKQFESLFLKMMLKSMREASFGNPLFDDSKTELYRDMADNQIALDLANGKGIGLADSLMKQLSKYTNNPQEKVNTKPFTTIQHTAPVVPLSHTTEANRNVTAFDDALPLVELKKTIPSGDEAGFQLASDFVPQHGKTMPVSFDTPEIFVRKMWPLAEKAAEQLGVSPRVLIAQAALETGWGKAVNKFQDGTSSHNLFNIKADQRWSGQTVNKSTLEFHAGTAKREVARFRAYDNYTDSFNDYVDFLKSNPRYQNALASSDQSEQFVNELQQAGYATDPHYAKKIISILQRDTMPVPDIEYQGNNNG